MIQSGGFLIANTDSFKMNEEDSSWFAEIVNSISAAGWPVQFLGKNENLLKLLMPFSYSVRDEMSYDEYLKLLPSFRFGLVPVAQSDYSDAKSPIKLIEFLGAGMTVLASDIRPYRMFRSEYPETKLRLLENKKEHWHSAIQSLLAAHPVAKETKEVTALLKRSRERQLEGWKAVSDRLKQEVRFPDPAAYEKLQSSMRNFYRIQRLANTRVGRLIRGLFR
jgi:hypothetical protein